MSFVVALVTGLALQAQVPVDWSIDRTELTVGGCCTLTIDADRINLRSVSLWLDDREVGPLAILGPSLPGERATHVLLWWDPTRACPAEDGTGARRTCPLFDREGRVSLRLASDAVIEKTIEVTVAAPDAAARGAMELLFPQVDGPAAGAADRARWGLLIASCGTGPQSTENRAVVWPTEEVEAVVGHPDWADVAPLLLARQEFLASLRGDQAHAEPLGMPDKSTIAKAMSVLDEAGKAQAESPFAQGILTRLNEHRRKLEPALGRSESESKR